MRFRAFRNDWLEIVRELKKMQESFLFVCLCSSRVRGSYFCPTSKFCSYKKTVLAAEKLCLNTRVALIQILLLCGLYARGSEKEVIYLGRENSQFCP